MTPQRLAALRAMAEADESPHERDIARAKLDAAGVGWREPPRRPPAAPAPGYSDEFHLWTSTTATTGWTDAATFVFTVTTAGTNR